MDEFLVLEASISWDLEKRFADWNTIKAKWVLDMKRNGQDNIVHYETLIVANRFPKTLLANSRKFSCLSLGIQLSD